MFIRRTDAEPEASVVWPPNAKSWLTGKDTDAGKDWGQEEKGATEDKIVGWHHWFSGHEFEQTLGDSEGQGSLRCCSPWICKESDTAERLNNNLVTMSGRNEVLGTRPSRRSGPQLIPGPGRSHMLLNNDACVPQLLSLCSKSLRAATPEAWAPRVHAPQQESSPRSPQLGKACASMKTSTAKSKWNFLKRRSGPQSLDQPCLVAKNWGLRDFNRSPLVQPSWLPGSGHQKSAVVSWLLWGPRLLHTQDRELHIRPSQGWSYHMIIFSSVALEVHLLLLWKSSQATPDPIL